MRLSIEITAEQHQLLKMAATLQGESIKDYVLKRTLPDFDEQAALQKLEAYLKPRIVAAKKGNYALETVDEIFDQVLQQVKPIE